MSEKDGAEVVLKKMQSALTGSRTALMIGIVGGAVRMTFPHKIDWYEMTPDEADALAAGIKHFATRLRG